MDTLAQKLIIYDSDCRLCCSLKDLLLRITTIPAEQVIAYKKLPEALKAKIEEERFHNEMALIDTGEEATLYGPRAIACILSDRQPWLGKMLKWPPLFSLFTFLYRNIAYNRYQIITPRSRFQCDCFPENVLRYRISYVLITMAITAGLLSLLSLAYPASVIQASQLLGAAATVWLIQILAAMILLKDEASVYLGHTGSLMVSGSILLMPAPLAGMLGFHSPYILLANAVFSGLYTIASHRKRSLFMGLRYAWTIGWAASLAAAALCWIYLYR